LVAGGVEVEDVAGVVAVAQEDAAAGVGGQGDGDDLLGGGGGEHVADDGAVGHAGSDPAGEGGIVPGSAADYNGDLPGSGWSGADETAWHRLHVLGERGGEPRQCLTGEVGRIIVDLGHRCLQVKGCWRLYEEVWEARRHRTRSVRVPTCGRRPVARLLDVRVIMNRGSHHEQA
jgi:hypothetical protein